MVQDELEGMAERCGWGQGNTWDDCMCCSTFDLEAFAKLVAKKEREACAELVYNSPPSDEYESELKAVYDAIRARGEEV